MSGKSTLLKQIALLYIMAQVRCSPVSASNSADFGRRLDATFPLSTLRSE